MSCVTPLASTQPSVWPQPLWPQPHLHVTLVQEFFSRERRHEIVMLRWREVDHLGPQPTGIMCGREPHLFPCPQVGWDVCKMGRGVLCVERGGGVVREG